MTTPSSATSPGPAGTSSAAPALPWNALVERIERSGSVHLANMLRMQVRVIELRQDLLRYSLAPGFKDDLSADLRKALAEVSGTAWLVEREEQGGEPSLVEQDEARRAEEKAALRRHPLVDAVYAAFPGATEFTPEDEPSFGRKNWSKRA